MCLRRISKLRNKFNVILIGSSFNNKVKLRLYFIWNRLGTIFIVSALIYSRRNKRIKPDNFALKEDLFGTRLFDLGVLCSASANWLIMEQL